MAKAIQPLVAARPDVDGGCRLIHVQGRLDHQLVVKPY